MKKNGFLMGILNVALIFSMVLFVDCKTNDDDDDNDGVSWTAVSDSKFSNEFVGKLFFEYIVFI